MCVYAFSSTKPDYLSLDDGGVLGAVCASGLLFGRLRCRLLRCYENQCSRLGSFGDYRHDEREQHIEEHTASNSTSLQFTSCFTSAYDEYKIEIVNLLPATNSVTFNLNFSTNGGTSYDTGANYSVYAVRYTGSTVTPAGGAGKNAIDPNDSTGDNLGNAAADAFLGSHTISNVNSSTQ